MKKSSLQLTATGKFSGTVCITWIDGNEMHEERLYSENFSMWRDVFPGDMYHKLLGRGCGETVKTAIAADNLPFSYKKELLFEVQPWQISLPLENMHPGRFYPQSILSGVPGVFKETVAPCRVVEKRDGKLIVDLNHPLARQDLTFAITVQEIFPDRTERGGRCEDWLERVCENGPGMQAAKHMKTIDLSTGTWNTRDDESRDTKFYEKPRLVQHLDSTARRLLCNQYSRLLDKESRVLDLMASWDSHLPISRKITLTLLGLNTLEMQENRRADAALCQDLNVNPELPFPDNTFDLTICTASIEYLTDPISVLAEAGRTLKTGGRLALSFSNRWFPSKAIRLWSLLHEFERVGFVSELLRRTGRFREVSTLSIRGFPRPDDDPYQEMMYADPVYVVAARKI